jgi:putative ABC transport system ATP-binding protein
VSSELGISTRNISKIFRTETVETSALSDINLDIEDGEFISLMGASGCGKSTLLHILGLIDSPTSGNYRFLDREVANCSERARAIIRKNNIGFVFQSFNLIDELTVYENVELPLVYARLPKDERRTRVHEVLDKMDMAHRSAHFPRQLSGGQQQRVAVARAVVNRPALVLADEPTGNLDSTHGDEVMTILRRLNEEGSTVVMVTHSEHDAAFANRMIKLKDGRILAAG